MGNMVDELRGGGMEMTEQEPDLAPGRRLRWLIMWGLRCFIALGPAMLAWFFDGFTASGSIAFLALLLGWYQGNRMYEAEQKYLRGVPRGMRLDDVPLPRRYRVSSREDNRQ